jgi:hypothetical protein
MGDLKPLGSEKLQGQDKLKRIMEIARFNEVIPNSINETAKSEYSIQLADGNNYEIVKERQGYVIKKIVTESETEYIEPMKNRKYYSSYSQAFKRLNLVAGELNKINENEEGLSLYGEQKKFVLRTPKPTPEELPAPPAAETPAAPPAVPSPELPPSPVGDAPPTEGGDAPMGDEMGGGQPEGGDEMGGEDMGGEDMGNEGGQGLDEKVTFKTIQKLTGKLTQKIRTLDNEQGMTSEDIKYVINMVLSSLDLKNLSEEDKEDILTKFEDADEREEGGENMGGDNNMGNEEQPDLGTDMGSDMGTEGGQEMPVEGEFREASKHGAILDHIFGESKVDKVISKYFEVSKKEILENREKNTQKKLINIKRQMKEVVKLTETIEQELASKKFLQENSRAKIVGKTNKKNLVFENKGKQVRISPEGLLA